MATALPTSLLVISSIGVWLYRRATSRAERSRLSVGAATERTCGSGPLALPEPGLLPALLHHHGLPASGNSAARLLPAVLRPLGCDRFFRLTLVNYQTLFNYPAVARSFQNS